RQIRRIGDPGGGDVHEVFQAPVLFRISKVQLNGMITNDKFCCTRWDQLQLSWWRRPLRLRGGAAPEPRESTSDALRQHYGTAQRRSGVCIVLPTALMSSR